MAAPPGSHHDAVDALAEQVRGLPRPRVGERRPDGVVGDEDADAAERGAGLRRVLVARLAGADVDGVAGRGGAPVDEDGAAGVAVGRPGDLADVGGGEPAERLPRGRPVARVPHPAVGRGGVDPLALGVHVDGLDAAGDSRRPGGLALDHGHRAERDPQVLAVAGRGGRPGAATAAGRWRGRGHGAAGAHGGVRGEVQPARGQEPGARPGSSSSLRRTGGHG